jgi:glutamate dehydrogenase (NAD(P)+)
MAWMYDTYLSTIAPHDRNRSIHVVTGKPIQSGGSRGRDKATGQGIVFCIEQWAKENGFNLDEATYIVQGFGNVGSWTARLLQARGARLIAVEDHTGALYNPQGMNADALAHCAHDYRGIAAHGDGERVDHAAFLSTKADFFVPAALENQVTADTAPLLSVRMVAEGANGPTTTQGDEVLRQRGITVLPDILCNAGGVAVSYFEWLQNKRSESWDLEEVDARLEKLMVAAYQRVRDRSRSAETDWRTGAYIVALSRLETVYKERGIFP